MNSGNILVIIDKNESQVCAQNGNASKIRNGSTSPIKYTIFSMFSHYATSRGENYWAQIFMNAAHDSFKKGYKFDGVILSIKVKNSIKKLNVSLVNQNDPNEFYALYELTKTFITETTGASCNIDDNSVFVQLPNEKIEEKGWSGTIPTRQQNALINVFVNDMTEKYKLSTVKSEDLKESLTGMILNGDITSNEITFENWTITNISCVIFQEGNFIIKEKPFKITTSKKRKISSPSVTDNIDKETYVFKCSHNLSSAGRRAPVYI